MVNATILNGMGAVGSLNGRPEFKPLDKGGELIEMDFDYSEVIWPWSGYLALYIKVKVKGESYQGPVGELPGRNDCGLDIRSRELGRSVVLYTGLNLLNNGTPKKEYTSFRACIWNGGHFVASSIEDCLRTCFFPLVCLN